MFSSEQVLVQSGRNVVLECAGRAWLDPTKVVLPDTGASVEYKDCRLQNFDFPGTVQRDGSRTLLTDSFIDLDSDCSVCAVSTPSMISSPTASGPVPKACKT